MVIATGTGGTGGTGGTLFMAGSGGVGTDGGTGTVAIVDIGLCAAPVAVSSRPPPIAVAASATPLSRRKGLNLLFAIIMILFLN